MMKVFMMVAVAFFLFCSDAYAKPRNRYYSSNNSYSMPTVTKTQSMPTMQSYTSSYSGASNSTAQGVAEMMAQRGYVCHFGGNTGYEGCGSGSSPDQAYRNCCYSNSGMTTVDVGYAQGRNGRWYCCRRYR